MDKKSKLTIISLNAYFIIAILNFLLSASRVFSADNHNLLFLQAFDNNKFVENLSMDDVEVYVNGQQTKVKGMVLVKDLKIKKAEGEKITSPILPRILILEFKANDYDQKIGKTVEILFRRPYSSEDIISLATSIKPYGFSAETLRNYSPSELINAGLTILKRDISMLGRNYNEITQEMTRLVLELPKAILPRDILTHYKQNLENLKGLRTFNEHILRRAIEHFAGLRAQKHYIIIYQQEFLPIPSSDSMERLLSNPNTMFLATELFRSIETPKELDLDLLIQELIDSRFIVNFLYFKTNPRPRPEIRLKELSLDMYELYSRIARATSGVVETTAQPAVQVEKILQSLENYFLISFVSPNLQDSTKFESEIRVNIKERNYSLKYFKL